MSKLPQHLDDFAKKYSLGPADFWEVRRGAWAILHKALERVAMNAGIEFGPPQILALDLDKKQCAIVVTGKRYMKEPGITLTDWSTGEAAPANNKNSYPLAMAEKRAKDRVALKLLQMHGDLYSDSEFEEEKGNGKHDPDHGSEVSADTHITNATSGPKRGLIQSRKVDGDHRDYMFKINDVGELADYIKNTAPERSTQPPRWQVLFMLDAVQHGFAIAESPSALHKFRTEFYTTEFADKLTEDGRITMEDRFEAALAKFDFRSQLKDSVALSQEKPF